MNFKKILIVITSLSILMTLFVGCDKKETGPVTLQVLTWRNEDAKVFEKLNKMFEEKNENIKIDMQITTSDTAEYYGILKTRVLGNQDVDIVSIHPGAYMTDYAPQMMDLKGKPVLDGILSSMLDAGTVDGKVVAIPQAQNSTLIFYNKKIFKQFDLSPPSTWAELLSLIDKLNENDMAPMSVGMADNWTTIWLYDNIQAGLTDDPKVFMKLGKELQLTDPAFADTIKGLQELGKHNFTQKDAIGTKYEASLALFAQEKAAMLDTGTWSVGGLKEQNPDIELGFFAMPSPNDKITVQITPAQAFGIIEKSKNKDAAMKYMEFLFSKEAMEIYGNETGQLVTREDAKLDVPELNDIQAILSSVKTVPQYRLYSQDPKIDGDILPAAGVRAVLGEDFDKIIADMQSELEQLDD